MMDARGEDTDLCIETLPAGQVVAWRMALPAVYRFDDARSFHGRDLECVAEQVMPDGLHKAFVWRGAAVHLAIRLRASDGVGEALCDASVTPAVADPAGLVAVARGLLGLQLDVAAFVRAVAPDAHLAALVAQRPGLRIPQCATPFEALSWAITGQQISLAVAISLRRKLIRLAGRPLDGQRHCYPSAKDVAALRAEDLRAVGFSTAKAATLVEVAQRVADGALPLDAWLGDALPADDIRQRLLALRGIGPWTVNYCLLRGFACADASLHGDVALRKALQHLLQRDEKPGIGETEAWLQQFSPWRSLVAAHLWASL
ncbi:DNA-3-methyladenine glycosylase 2 [Uliginosibacterium sp. H1]|uniref:DNA-3-methyladenine glycosylase 2 n=1 Tax=Uliginosibacterium sp. H1 TaxID=3114757 RepID=UPI002E17A2B0|nr:hypothetical protein [Uliginosibacterium sp. H1]